MRKILFLLFIFFLGIYVGNKTCKQNIYIQQERSVPTPKKYVASHQLTQAQEVANLERTFLSYGSPLASQSAYLVGVAHRYGIDYRLLPAIAFTESTLCKNYIRRTHNCYGYGSGTIGFSDFEEASDRVARSITTSYYYKKWNLQRNNIYELAKPYNAVSPEKWTTAVVTFMEGVKTQ